MHVLREHGLIQCSHIIGKTRPASSPVDAGKGELQVWRDANKVFGATLSDLHQVWDAVSWKICQQRDNPACADSEHAAAGEPTDPGMHVHLTFDPQGQRGCAFPQRGCQAPRGRAARAGRELARGNGLCLHRSWF